MYKIPLSRVQRWVAEVVVGPWRLSSDPPEFVAVDRGWCTPSRGHRDKLPLLDPSVCAQIEKSPAPPAVLFSGMVLASSVADMMTELGCAYAPGTEGIYEVK